MQFSNFFLSACLMLLFANIACGSGWMRDHSAAAKDQRCLARFGGGELAAAWNGVRRDRGRPSPHL